MKKFIFLSVFFTISCCLFAQAQIINTGIDDIIASVTTVDDSQLEVVTGDGLGGAILLTSVVTVGMGAGIYLMVTNPEIFTLLPSLLPLLLSSSVLDKLLLSIYAIPATASIVAVEKWAWKWGYKNIPF